MNSDLAPINADIDAMFESLRRNHDYDPAEPLEWLFCLRSQSLSSLEQLADRLNDKFHVQLQEHAEELTAGGAHSTAGPLLAVTRYDAFSADQIKSIAAELIGLAGEADVQLEAVECFAVADHTDLADAECFEWLDLKQACDQLERIREGRERSVLETSCGYVPWAFLLLADQFDKIARTAQSLNQAGFEQTEIYDEPDDHGHFVLCVFVTGNCQVADLVSTHDRIIELGSPLGVRMEGLQFLTEQQLNDEEAETGD